MGSIDAQNGTSVTRSNGGDLGQAEAEDAVDAVEVGAGDVMK